MLFFIVSLMIILVHSEDYLLQLHMQQQLNVTEGMELNQLIVSSQQIYALVTNETHFQLIHYHWPDDFAISDKGPFYEAYMQSGSSNFNPQLSLDSSLTVIYRNVSQEGTKVLRVNPNDLNLYSSYSFNESFMASYVPSMRSFYLKYDDGKEEAIRYFPTSDEIVFEDNNFTSLENTIEDYLVLVSKYSKYVITIDKPTGILMLHEFKYNWDGTINASSTSEIHLNATIFSACFYEEYSLFLQSNDNCLYNLRLSTLEVICYNITYNQTDQCYYEPTTQSVIIIESSNQTVTLRQLSIISDSRMEYTFNSSRVLYLGLYMVYLGDKDSFNSFKTQSCSTTFNYIAGELKCQNCAIGCDTCNGSLYCNSCSNRYVQTTYGSTYAQFYQYCGPCPSHCSNCSSTSVCITCDIGYQLTSNYQCKALPASSVVPVIGITGLEALLKALTSITDLTDVIPSARSIFRPVLYILISFDDFFPYMFHQRFYGKTIESLFKTIHNSETEKWSTYDNYCINPILDLMNINQNNLTSEIDYYYNYSSPIFIAREQNGESVLISIFSFITTNVVVSFIIFIIFKTLFHLLYQFRISLIFRPQSFWPYLAFFIMEGNLQVVTFYTTSILRVNFFLSPVVKFQAALVYFILFFLILFAVAAYFLVFQKLGSLTKYFGENVNSSFFGLTFLTIQCGLKNLLLALVHSLLRATDLYKLQFICLIGIEIMCLINYFFFLKVKNFFKVKGRTLILMTLGMTRISFISVLFVQQGIQNDESTLSLLDSSVEVVLTIYFIVIFIGFGHNILLAVIELGRFLIKCITKPRAPKREVSSPKVKEESKKQEEIHINSRVQNQKEMMRVYFANKAINVKNPRNIKPGVLKITTFNHLLKKTKPV